MNLISHINQPNRLLLAWQPPEGKSRSRYVVGELHQDEKGYVFRYLTDTTDFKNAQEEGFICHPAFRKLNLEYRDSVLDTFLRRIPPKTRSDFNQYLQQWRLASDIKINDFALLGHTGAKLPNDGFSLVNPFEDVDLPFEFFIEVAGFRHQGVSLDDVAEGMSVQFIPEPENQFDTDAVRIEAAGKKIGYVNKVQSAAFRRWLKNYSILACIERINGIQERPLIYIFGSVNPA
jgi:hypothetical protein